LNQSSIMSPARPNPDQRELELRRELELLGEEPPSPDELALLEQDGEQEPEIAIVSRLVELAQAERFDSLSELELHRGWRSVEQRAVNDGSVEHGGPVGRVEHVQDGHRPTGGGARRWLFAAVGGLAAAAAVLFVVFGPERDTQQQAAEAPSSEQVAEMGEQVRATLRVLDDGKSDSERAVERAAEYQRRLAQRQEQDG
jgi:hypothetical protein